MAKTDAVLVLLKACVDIAPLIPKGTQPHGQDMTTTIRMSQFRKFHAALANAIADTTRPDAKA